MKKAKTLSADVQVKYRPATQLCVLLSSPLDSRFIIPRTELVALSSLITSQGGELSFCRGDVISHIRAVSSPVRKVVFMNESATIILSSHEINGFLDFIHDVIEHPVETESSSPEHAEEVEPSLALLALFKDLSSTLEEIKSLLVQGLSEALVPVIQKAERLSEKLKPYATSPVFKDLLKELNSILTDYKAYLAMNSREPDGIYPHHEGFIIDTISRHADAQIVKARQTRRSRDMQE